jgi:Histidine kinase
VRVDGVLTRAINAMLDRIETERRESAWRAIAAQEAERLRIARELHDEVGQTLTAVALQVERVAAEGAVQSPTLGEIGKHSCGAPACAGRVHVARSAGMCRTPGRSETAAVPIVAAAR